MSRTREEHVASAEMLELAERGMSRFVYELVGAFAVSEKGVSGEPRDLERDRSLTGPPERGCLLLPVKILGPQLTLSVKYCVERPIYGPTAPTYACLYCYLESPAGDPLFRIRLDAGARKVVGGRLLIAPTRPLNVGKKRLPMKQVVLAASREFPELIQQSGKKKEGIVLAAAPPPAMPDWPSASEGQEIALNIIKYTTIIASEKARLRSEAC